MYYSFAIRKHHTVIRKTKVFMFIWYNLGQKGTKAARANAAKHCTMYVLYVLS